MLGVRTDLARWPLCGLPAPLTLNRFLECSLTAPLPLTQLSASSAPFSAPLTFHSHALLAVLVSVDSSSWAINNVHCAGVLKQVRTTAARRCGCCHYGGVGTMETRVEPSYI